MSAERKAFYEYHSSLMEPWDGPASIAFTDGTVIGAVLDRNGLRPSRYYVTKDDLVIMASEVGVLDIPPENIAVKERLHPGRIFLVDTAQGASSDDGDQARAGGAQPVREWLASTSSTSRTCRRRRTCRADHETVLQRQQAFGYTQEDLRLLLAPMAAAARSRSVDGHRHVAGGAVGRPRLLYDYFKQLFAQVTNPPLDAIREELVTSMGSTIGPRATCSSRRRSRAGRSRSSTRSSTTISWPSCGTSRAGFRRSRCRCCSIRPERRRARAAMDELCSARARRSRPATRS
jgi:hypothetical protein